MRLTLLCSVFLALAPVSLGAQTVRWGVRTGVTVASTPDDIERFEFAARNYALSIEDIRLGFHGGLVLQARLGKVALQPEVLVHSTRTDYRLDELVGGNIVETILSERYTNVEIPVMVAYRWGPVRLQAGPVGRAYVTSRSDLEGVAGYEKDPADFTLGYQAGIGFDIRRVLLDIKYDGSFDDERYRLMIGGRDLAFGRTPGRTFITLGFLFN